MKVTKFPKVKKVDWDKRPARFVEPICSESVKNAAGQKIKDGKYNIVDIHMRIRITEEEMGIS